ncbi:Fatty aldehyde dehydrogenase [Yarrowia sp. B02]|nr:Fatty aldehyde dehydrogenase [Yarrowia sp. B02]
MTTTATVTPTASLPKEQETPSSLNTAVPAFDWESICGKTPLEQIESDINRLKNFYRSEKTLDLDYRLDQIRNLAYAIRDNEKRITDAIQADLKRPDFESMTCEFAGQLGEFNYVVKNLPKWVKDEKVKGTSITYWNSSPVVHKRPLGTVLVITPWNYPLVLSVSPVLGAIAAGNTVCLKMSEMSPNASKVIGDIMTEALDPGLFQVFYGGVPETTEILKHRFDKIMYTGNGKVGRIICEAANKYLTPVELELGGKSPVFVTKHCGNMEVAAKRILWGKFVNGGQTCVAPDYILVAPEVHDKFVAACIKVLDKFYPNHSAESGMAHIATPQHFERLTSLLNSTRGKVVYGGTTDPATRFIAPTIVDGVDANDSLMQGELFGPLLPIVKAMPTEAATNFVLDHHPCPLAEYIFSENQQEIDYIRNRVTSGGLVINDTIVHVGCVQAPFGGVGDSGNGGYHGKHTFDLFSHSQTILRQPGWVEFLNKKRYPPYKKSNAKFVRRMIVPSPNFPRHGPVRGFWSKLFG